MAPPSVLQQKSEMDSRVRHLVNADLREVCRSEGLQVSGVKSILQRRIWERESCPDLPLRNSAVAATSPHLNVGSAYLLLPRCPLLHYIDHPPSPPRVRVGRRDLAKLTTTESAGIEHYVQKGDLPGLNNLDFHIKNPLAKYRNIKPPPFGNSPSSSSHIPLVSPHGRNSTSGLSSSDSMGRPRTSFNSINGQSR
jgi:hypothetical protein